jgi:hypothetical protein
MFNGYKIGLITPTRGREREIFLTHAKWQIQQQTVKPDIALIVDYEPESDNKDITQRYRRGFENLFNEEKCDVVLCWEDDDYYKPNYIEKMIHLWLANNKPVMFGFNNSYYYNINDQKWFNVWHTARASMMNTLVTKEVIKEKWIFPDDDPWTDFRLWTTIKNTKAVKYNEVLCIGIKHNIGMVGGNNHGSIYQNADTKHIVDDNGMKWLESQVDIKSIELYRSLSKTYQSPVIKEVDIVVPCNTLNEELRLMTEQFIENLVASETEIKFNIYLLEQNKDINYKAVQTIYYDFDFNYNKVMNYGYTFCKNQYVCFVNNDVVFEQGWATELIKQIEKHNILSASPFNPYIHKKTGKEIIEGYRVRREMCGWCIMIDRKVFDIIGKFDESVNFWHSEVVYADQLKAANLKHILCENSHVNHYDKSRTLNKLPRDKYHEYTIKQVQLYDKKKLHS